MNFIPFKVRLKIADNVSMIGSINNKIGNANVKIVLDLNPSNEIAEIMNPKNNDPQSPIKILAGCAL